VSLINSKHSIIGCHCDGYGVAFTLAESLGEEGYHVLENWYQAVFPGYNRVIDKFDELFYYENTKPNRKVEIFINNLPTLEISLTKKLKANPNQVKIATISPEEAFTLINSLLVEDKISLSDHTLALEKDLRKYDPLSVTKNHQVHSIFNAIAQAESNRLTLPERVYSVSGHINRSRGCPSVFS
jgi:hypothetical protein